MEKNVDVKMLQISINDRLKDIYYSLIAVQQLSGEFKLSITGSDSITKMDLLDQFEKSLSELLIMFNAQQQEKYELNVILTALELLISALSTLQICKMDIVQSRAYEYAARFRDIEIHIELLIKYWHLFSHCNKTDIIKVK